MHNETKERWWERVDHIGYFTGTHRNDHPVPAAEAGQLWLQDQQGDPGPADRRYELKEATLYSAFKRLEQAGCIRTYWGDETTGARRRYYSITEKGRETYASNRRDWEEAKELIDRLLDDDGEGTA